MDNQGNQHCANCIGTLSFSRGREIDSRARQVVRTHEPVPQQCRPNLVPWDARPYPWTRSVSWSLAESYWNRHHRRPKTPVACEGLYVSTKAENHRPSWRTVMTGVVSAVKYDNRYDPTVTADNFGRHCWFVCDAHRVVVAHFSASDGTSVLSVI